MGPITVDGQTTKPAWHKFGFLDDLSKHSWLRIVAFMTIFAAVGTYLVFTSFADSTTVATLQAEQMKRSASTVTMVSDASASGGSMVKMTDTGTNVSGSVNLPGSASSVTVVAKADNCRTNGWPKMKLLVDGKVVLPMVSVPSNTWASYTARTSLGAGSHSVKLAYPASTTTCTPTLYADVITFYGSTPTTPPPTVSLAAAPSAVSSGQTSTLTWSSVNATSCTAGGLWSGTQATSGSYTTPALTADSSYSITCTGAGGSATANASVAVTSTTTPGTIGIWRPTADKPIAFHWVLGNTLNVTDPVQMGLRDFNGNTLPPPDVYDIDGEDNTASTVSYLHSQGKKVVCYIDVGAYETYRSDAYKFQALSPQIWGSADQGWAGSYWLDIHRVNDLAPIMKARMQMCKDKGFDAVEPDEMTGYSNSPGFPLTYADQITYNKAVAGWAHAIGLSVGQKGDLEQAHDLVGVFDWTLNEECYEFGECTTVSNSGPGADGKDYPGLQLYAQQNKAVWIAEYKSFTTTQWTSFCSDSATNHFNTTRFKLGLPNSGGRMPCATSSPTSW